MLANEELMMAADRIGSMEFGRLVVSCQGYTPHISRYTLSE
jgi:hypothetical protein